MHTLNNILKLAICVKEASQFRGSLKLDVSVSFFGAGLLRTISTPDYPEQEGTKYYLKVQEPDSYDLQGKAQVFI